MTEEKKKRKEALLSYICRSDEEKMKYENIIDDMLFIESQLEYLKTLPFIRVNKDNPALQKPTPAHRQYKELLNAYVLIVKMLSRDQDEGEVESPLRLWMKAHIKE